MKKKLQVSRFSDKDMSVTQRFFEREFPNGCIEPQAVVTLAKPKNSPIHKYFTWDIEAAAEKYWLMQARKLIRCVVVEIDGTPTRKYVSPVVVENYERKQYVSMEIARASEDIWEQVLFRAIKDAKLWKLRYDHLKELTLISKSIVQVERKLRQEGKLNEEAR